MLNIRPALPKEKSKLEDLQLRASLVWEEYRAALIANPDAIELPLEQILAGQAFVAETDGRIAGFSVVNPREDGDAELEGLFVDPNEWRKGIGAALVRDAGDRAFQKGARSMHVIANPRAEAFYLACGFEFCGEEQTRFGPARRMRRSLVVPR